jgi:hypothetical protein
VDVTILPTGEAPVIRFNDLSKSRALIDVAYRSSAALLEGRPVPADEGRAEVSPHHG